MRYGMRTLTTLAVQTLTGLAVICFVLAWLLANGQPPLWLFMAYMMLTFFCVGVLFGNLNALAMEPLGHIAGVGAAVVGSLATLLSVFLGTLVGQSFNGTILPLVGGFAILGLAAMLTMRWVEQESV
jgi:DHA1 family bicyclomycin/chloramphenicol resistance-like MFS transporter